MLRRLLLLLLQLALWVTPQAACAVEVIITAA
jgi:hypothetical protein